MIEKLKLKDVREAAKVYNKGLQMEIPKGYATLDETIKHFGILLSLYFIEVVVGRMLD